MHDRFLLPSFVEQDFADVLTELNQAGFAFEPTWFAPHFSFRFPHIGDMAASGVHVELRAALEPWHVMGEEGSAGGTVRYVDSSLERIEVRATGLNPNRHVITVNGEVLPLHPTGRVGEYVAGVRYRAWQPPSCLHPTIEADAPLTLDVVDSWLQRSVGGCQYHVATPVAAITIASRSMPMRRKAGAWLASSAWGIRRARCSSSRCNPASNTR